MFTLKGKSLLVEGQILTFLGLVPIERHHEPVVRTPQLFSYGAKDFGFNNFFFCIFVFHLCTHLDMYGQGVFDKSFKIGQLYFCKQLLFFLLLI